MRGFLKFVCSSILVLGIPLLIFAAVPRLNGYSTVKLQQQLVQQQIYDQASDEIHSRLSGMEETGDPLEAGTEADVQSQLTNLILAQITPAYLQTKTEDLTNQVAAWATGQTTTPPELSLNDLQQQIMSQSPATQAQLNQLLVELRQAQDANGGQLPQVSGDPESQAALEGLLQSGTNLEQLANGDWTFSLKEPLAGLPLAYQIYYYGLPLSGLLLLLCLVGLILTGTTWPQRLKNVGWTLLIAGVWNGILASVFNWGVMQWMLKMIPGMNEHNIGSSLITAVRLSVLENFVMIQLIATASLIALGIVLLIVATVTHRSSAAAQPPQHSQPPEPPKDKEAAPKVVKSDQKPS